jgi:hypothetical protein
VTRFLRAEVGRDVTAAEREQRAALTFAREPTLRVYVRVRFRPQRHASGGHVEAERAAQMTPEQLGESVAPRVINAAHSLGAARDLPLISRSKQRSCSRCQARKRPRKSARAARSMTKRI